MRRRWMTHFGPTPRNRSKRRCSVRELDAEVAGDLPDPRDVRVGDDVIHGVVDQLGALRAGTAAPFEDGLHAADRLVHVDVGVTGADARQAGGGLGSEQLGGGESVVGEPGRPVGPQRREAGGSEAHADRPATAGQDPPEAPGDHPCHRGPIALDREVDAGVAEDGLNTFLPGGNRPLDYPVVVEDVIQRR
jgi:hypothetical protein